MSNSKKLLVVAHAPSENTRQMAEAVKRGASNPEITSIEVIVKAPVDTQPDDFLSASAVIIGTTENLGYMAGLTKDVFDRCYYPCLEKTQGLPFAFYIRAGHDGTGTKRAIESVTTGLKWRMAQEPLICRGDFQEQFIAQCETLGLSMAASLDAGII